jgi:competence ComEA-like helix-hairpin-helix protein
MKKVILVFVLLATPLFVWGALININTADFGELKNITGVGDTLAGRIIEYRNANGFFKTIEDLGNVTGIGHGTKLSKLKDEITVGSGNSPVVNPPPDQNIDDNSESDDDSSVHTGETEVSNYTKESFKISAGRERLATIRTPILFSASQNKTGKDSNYFVWSFGDGTSATGVKVYHTYQFPGRYNVVLNGSIDNEEEAVARTVVTVTEAEIKITNVDLSAGFVELTNNSDKEQNLNNWGLRAGGREYPFPLDTIISPRTAIKIPIKVLGLTNPNIQEIILVYPDGVVASGASLQTGPDLSKLTDLKKQLAEAKQQLASKTVQGLPLDKAPAPRNLVSGTTKSANNVVVLAKGESWWAKIKHAIFN